MQYLKRFLLPLLERSIRRDMPTQLASFARLVEQQEPTPEVARRVRSGG